MCDKKNSSLFYAEPEMRKSLSDVVEDWTKYGSFFKGPLETELGPMGQFKTAPECSIPSFLKNKPRTKIFEIIEDPSKKQQLATNEEKSTSVPVEIATELEEGAQKIVALPIPSVETTPQAKGISIVINKENWSVEVINGGEDNCGLADNERMKGEDAADTDEVMNKRKLKEERKNSESMKRADLLADAANLIKIDMRQLINGSE